MNVSYCGVISPGEISKVVKVSSKKDADMVLSYWSGYEIFINQSDYKMNIWLEENCGIHNLDWIYIYKSVWIRDKEKAALLKLFWI